MKRPIFITARFRTGSTMLWNLFRQLPEVCAYYEPLHDYLVPYIKYPAEVQKSHLYVKSYFDEYLNAPNAVSLHRTDFANYKLYLESQDSYSELYAYIHALVESVPALQTPVLQFNRIDFRLAWIKKNFPDVVLLHLARNPRDEWYSTLEPFNIDIDKDIDFDGYDLTTWARDLYKQFPFLATPQIEHIYQRFYYLWKLSYLAGQRLSDLTVSYEDILSNPQKKVTELLYFADLYSDRNLDICLKIVESNPKRAWKKDREDSWFDEMEQKCEIILDELGLNRDFALLPLQEIQNNSPKYQEMLNDPENVIWAQNSLRKQIAAERVNHYEINNSLNQSYKNAIKNIDTLQIQINQLNVERDQIRYQLDEIRDERDTVQSQFTQAQVELDKTQTQLDEIRDERDTVQSQFAQAQVELDKIQTKLELVQTDRDTIQTQLDKIQVERDQILTQLDEVRASREIVQAQLYETISEREAIKAELDHVYHCRSYRITAPLRAIFGFGRILRDRILHPHRIEKENLFQSIQFPNNSPESESITSLKTYAQSQSTSTINSIKNSFGHEFYSNQPDQITDFNLDEIMEKIRLEVESRKVQTAQVNDYSAITVKETILFRLIKNIQFISQKMPFYKQIYSAAIKIKPYIPKYYQQNLIVSDFLKYNDEEFIKNAYEKILLRKPDKDGYLYYLTALRNGRLNKIEILGRLRYSREGKQACVKIKGLPYKFVIKSIFKT